MNLPTAIRFAAAGFVCAGLYACATARGGSDQPLRIVAVDVEGGAATLFVSPEGRSLLIDTGWPAGRGGPRRAPEAAPAATPLPVLPSSADKIIAAARKAGLTRLDYVLITHYHLDHVGGFEELLGKFPVGTVLDHGANRELPPADADPAGAASRPPALFATYVAALAGHTRRSLRPGDSVELGSVTLTAVTSDGAVPGSAVAGATQANPHCESMPERSANGGEENARSLGVVLTYGSARVVSLGDVTWNLEKALVCPVNRVGRADLLLVSHHGSALSNSPALLHALAPRVAVMNNGAQKGGDAESYDTVAAAPGLQRLWQLHFAVKGGAARNPADAYIANPSDDPDANAALYVSVYADGRLTVVNGRSGFSESYPAVTTLPR